MALLIGFTNKYFTLWNCTTEENYSTANGKHYLASIRHHNNYIQNLSMDKDKAIAKAKEMGATDTSVHEDLRGVTRSFSRNEYFDEPKAKSNQFKYGKYKYEEFKLCNDLKYLLWYYYDGNTESEDAIYLIDRICELDASYTAKNGRLFTPLQIAYEDLSNGTKELIAISNFSTSDEQLEDAGTASIKVSFDAETVGEEELQQNNPYGVHVLVDVKDMDLQQRNYRGYDYYVPKGKRSFKNTTFTLLGDKLTIIDK